MPGDEEKRISGSRPVKGYAGLTAFICDDPDHSAAIYPRFEELGARNLLYLQSELAELKAQQDEYDRADFLGDVEAKKNARSYQRLKMQPERMQLVLDIRSKLKEYREAQIAEATIMSWRPPTKQAHAAFTQEFDYSVNHYSEPFPMLTDESSAALYNVRRDLVALYRPLEEDRMSMILRKFLPSLFETKKPERGSRVAQHSASRIQLTVQVISVLIAAGLLYGAILTFHFVRNEKVVLILIAAYTVAFALCVWLLTNAKRAELFAACAAYAAVIVVFVSRPGGSSS